MRTGLDVISVRNPTGLPALLKTLTVLDVEKALASLAAKSSSSSNNMAPLLHMCNSRIFVL